MSSCLLWTLTSIVQILNLEHVEESLVSIPFCKCKICVFGFLYEWCYFHCETVWPFVCVSSPLRTRWGRGWFRRPPQAAPDSPLTTPPTPTPPPITRPPSREGHPVLKQPGNLSTTLVCLKAFWMKSLMLICCRSHALHHQGEFLQFIIQFIALMGAEKCHQCTLVQQRSDVKCSPGQSALWVWALLMKIMEYNWCFGTFANF